MADHSSVLGTQIGLAETKTIYNTDSDVPQEYIDFLTGRVETSDHQKKSKVELIDNHDSVICEDGNFYDVLKDKIFLLPITSIDAGFITETTAYNIYLWNTFETPKTLVNIIKNNEDGTTLTDDTVPQQICARHQLDFVVQVLEDGDAIQDTQYQFVVSPFTPTLSIAGKRIEPFLFEPDWKELSI